MYFYYIRCPNTGFPRYMWQIFANDITNNTQKVSQIAYISIADTVKLKDKVKLDTKDHGYNKFMDRTDKNVPLLSPK